MKNTSNNVDNKVLTEISSVNNTKNTKNTTKARRRRISLPRVAWPTVVVVVILLAFRELMPDAASTLAPLYELLDKLLLPAMNIAYKALLKMSEAIGLPELLQKILQMLG